MSDVADGYYVLVIATFLHNNEKQNKDDSLELEFFYQW